MKKGTYILSLAVIFFLVWYFFIKSSDYIINFKSNTFPQTINQSLKLWDYNLENSILFEQMEDFSHIRQTIGISDSIHIYDWKIKAITDTTSKVSVGVKDKKLSHSLLNRLQVPFKKTNFSIGSEKLVLDFMTLLKDHLSNFKVTIIGVEDVPEKTIAYVPLKKPQMEKAKGMMETSNLISSILMQNGIELDGPPMIEVTSWNRTKDSIYYNYGYPIVPGQDLPKNTIIEYKTLKTKKGLKATFNGNYMSSDKAWYALLNYAKKHNIVLEELPIEIFYNNPNMGGDDLTWKTEVYLPIKETINK